MQNIPKVDLNQPGSAEDILNTIKANIGSVPNIFATMAQSPAVLSGFLAFKESLGTGLIDNALGEQIALAVAGENECDYCASAHTLIAQGAGVDKSEAAQNLRGQASDPKVAAVLSFVRTVVQSRGLVDGETVNNLRSAGLNEQEIVEVIAHISINIFTNYFNHIANTEVDFPYVTAAANQNAA